MRVYIYSVYYYKSLRDRARGIVRSVDIYIYIGGHRYILFLYYNTYVHEESLTYYYYSITIYQLETMTDQIPNGSGRVRVTHIY